MPNKFDQRKLLDQLIQDHDVELMPHELNDILEKELSKPAEDVDMRLVNDLLDLLGAEEPAPGAQKACWRNIQRARAKKRCNWRMALNRAAAIAAVLVVAFFVSFESAKAFRWTFLLKLLTPVAETFGIYSTGTLDSETPAGNPSAIMDEDTEYDQVTYAAIGQMPPELSGCRILPAWIPDRFVFLQGTTYEDPDMSLGSLYYQHNGDSLGVNTYIYHNDDAVVSFTYERTLSEPQGEEINGIWVNFYHNNEDGALKSASWIQGKAHYHVEGNITDAELREIVLGLMDPPVLP